MFGEAEPERTPHDWNPLTRLCRTCGVRSTDWFDGKAPNCPPLPAVTEPEGESWFATVGRRLREIEAEKEHPLVVVNL